MEPQPHTSVLIPTHQRREALRMALLCFAEQTVPPDEFEVIVAIDGSTDGTAEMIAALEVPYRLRSLQNDRGGRASACNAALELTQAEVVVILDDDMQVVPSFVERHAAHHPPGSRRCVIGAVPIALDDSSPPLVRYMGTKFNQHLERLAEPGHSFAPRDFYSGNASIRAEILREVGGFDQSFTAYGNEDVDLSLRLRAAGVTLAYDPAASASQGYDKDLAAVLRDTREKGHTTVALAGSHPASFGSLRLANPWDGSRPWLALRALLLALGRRLPASRGWVLAAARGLERAGLSRLPLFYRVAIDYAFWAGVDEAVGESSPEADLERLARELHRGPIDLLLQRQR
jgi:GT2 family glycosyltransferase